MLVDYLEGQREKFDSLVTAWMRVGATCVQLLERNQVLLSYPEGCVDADPALLVHSRTSNLSLRVYGNLDESWRPAAETVLAIMANLLASDADLEHLTAALVDTQDRLVAIYELTQVTRHTLEVPALLDLLIQESKHLLGIEGGFALLMENSKPTIAYQVSEDPLPTAQLEHAALLFRRDPTRHTFRGPETMPIGLHNVMMVSLPVRDEIFGVFGVFNKTGRFTSPDIKLAETIASHIGAQLENALLHQEAIERARLETEMDIARQVQTAILPQKLPTVAGLDIFGTSIPAYEVGGDFFDAFNRQEHALTFALGDVTGKGMPAAILMSMTQTITKSALRKQPFIHPHEVLDRLNSDLFEDFSNVGMFTTALVGEFDCSNNSLHLSNAGQSPVFYIPCGADPVLMEAQDIPIGVLDIYRYSSQSMQLAPGDILVVASDGFPESRNPEGEMFGYERMKTALDSSRGSAARDIAAQLLAEVQAFSGSHPQDDDRTIIVIKVVEKNEN